METSTARPQEAVERRGKGVRRAGRRMMAFVRGAARACGTGHDGLSVYLCAVVWHSVSLCGGAAARTGRKNPHR